MSKLTNKDYEILAKAFLKKGIKIKKVYKALEKSGFEVTVKGKLYSGIYAAKLMAIMDRTKSKKTKPLEL